MLSSRTGGPTPTDKPRISDSHGLTPKALLHASPAPAPVLGVALEPGGKLKIGWNTQSGLQYRLEICSDLSLSDWRTVLEFAGDGLPRSVEEIIAGTEPQRYYRITAE